MRPRGQIVTKLCSTSHWNVTHLSLMPSFQFSANHRGRPGFASLKREFWEESVTPNFPLILQSVRRKCQERPVNNYKGTLTASIEKTIFENLLFAQLFNKIVKPEVFLLHSHKIHLYNECNMISNILK